MSSKISHSQYRLSLHGMIRRELTHTSSLNRLKSWHLHQDYIVIFHFNAPRRLESCFVPCIPFCTIIPLLLEHLRNPHFFLNSKIPAHFSMKFCCQKLFPPLCNQSTPDWLQVFCIAHSTRLSNKESKSSIIACYKSFFWFSFSWCLNNLRIHFWAILGHAIVTPALIELNSYERKLHTII